MRNTKTTIGMKPAPVASWKRGLGLWVLQALVAFVLAGGLLLLSALIAWRRAPRRFFAFGTRSGA